MLKKLSTIVASFFIFTLSFGQASAFTDVPETAWFYEHVEELKSLGIIDDAPQFNPFEPLKRAELVKMVILAIDGLKNYEAPAFPTFYDAPANAWFSPHVEEAATRGIVSGYANAQGDLTGYFGPADVVTRAAAAKILVKTFNLKAQPNMMTPAFSDVLPNDWFYPYLNILASHYIIEGYQDGTFQGNKAVSRSEISKMLMLSMKAANPEVIIEPTPEIPEEEQPTTPETPETPTGTPAIPNAATLSDDLIFGGEQGKFIGRYLFQGSKEGFYVNTLTLANDTVGNNLGDEAKPSLAIKTLHIKFPDQNGMLQTASGSLKPDGTLRFSNLNFYVKKDVDTFLEIYADLNDFSSVGAELSGETFRVGLKDVNSTTDSFRAVGEFSGSVITMGNTNLSISTANYPYFTLRKTQPVFEMITPSGTLTNGTNNLISFKVTANAAGSLGLSRLTLQLDVNDNDNANLMLSNFRFYSGSDLVDNATIYDATGAKNLEAGSLTGGNATVIISFDEEEVISAGQSKTYHLKADITGSANEDSITTGFPSGDEDSPLTGLTAYEQENTGKIFVNGDATRGIFAGDSEFSQTVFANKNILWSDFSGEPHQYAQVLNGTVTSGKGSSDWTNAYGLGIISLPKAVLTK